MRPSITPRFAVRGWIAASLVLAAAPARADKVEDLSRALTSDPDFKVRLTAALVLGKLRDRRAEPALLHGLGDKNETVRGMSASSLGSLGDPAAVAALEPLARDKSDYVRARAREAIEILRPGSAAAPKRAGDKRMPIVLGSISNKSGRGGAHLVDRLREALVRLISDSPSVVLESREGGSVVDASINEVRVTPTAAGVDVACDLAFIVGRSGGSRAIVGMTSSGATVQVARMSWHPGTEELFLERACESAVASAHPNLVDLFRKAAEAQKK